jgi:hypothetical protein
MRLVKTAEAIAWPADLLFIGLTYHLPPDSVQLTKQHMESFKKRWIRAYDKPHGLWKLEFQRRGVPHYHLLLFCPSGESADTMRHWISVNWWQVTGETTPEHLSAGTRCESWHSKRSPGNYYAKHGSWRTKEYQNTCPAGDKPGRFWGAWFIKPDWTEYEIPEKVFFIIRRILRRLKRSRRRLFCRRCLARHACYIPGKFDQRILTCPLRPCNSIVTTHSERMLQGMWTKGPNLERILIFAAERQASLP